MTSTFYLAIKQSRLCRILTGTAAALLVLLYMEFGYFAGGMNVKPVEKLSVPEQRSVGKPRKNPTVYFRNTYTRFFQSQNTTNKTNSYIPKPQPSHVLLNAYHRSGSSYAGRLLSLHDDTFYWFEPLQTTLGKNFYSKNGSICDDLRPRCQDLDYPDFKSLNRSLEFLIDLYSCNLGKHFNRFSDRLMKSNSGEVRYNTNACDLNAKIIVDNCFQFDKAKMSSGKGLPSALQADASYRRCRLSGVQPEKCYLTYAKSCVKAKNIVTKIVRLDIHHTEVLLQKYPKLKVLQLMRDPRGIVNCRLYHTSWYPISDKSGARKRIEDNVKILCSKMRSDMEGARKLARQFPNRVRIIQYENIVRAQEKQDALYRYIGADILKRNIHLPHLAGKIQTSGPYSFRDQLSQSSLDIVQEHCSDIIEKLGLRVFSNYDEMRNTSIQVEKRRGFPFSI